MPGFFFGAGCRSLTVRDNFHSANFSLVRFCRMQDVFTAKSCGLTASLKSATIFENPVASTRCVSKGYPVSLGKKSCVRLVTYQQCTDHHFEKWSAPLKRKFFMNFFLSNCAAYCSRLRISIRRADSTPCHPDSKAAASICEREDDSVGMRDLPQPLHTN
jgi:hypothetical protein